MKFGHFVLLLLCVWVAFVVGVAAGDVGEVAECSGEPYHWTFPLFVGFILGAPMLTAYWAGRSVE